MPKTQKLYEQVMHDAVDVMFVFAVRRGIDISAMTAEFDVGLGPGPHAAFGMTLLVHHQVVRQKDGTDRFDDNGIGTHGSASVTSIVNGTSHGCHRLYNQLAVRLADFLLRHREHVVKGDQPEQYRRVVSHNGTFLAKVDTRGFLYELTPPVPVDVLPGTILSERKTPPRDSAPARP